MKDHIKLVLRIIARGIDLLLDTSVDVGKTGPVYRGSIEGLWMARK